MYRLTVREVKDIKGFGPKDTLVIFGEFFKGGYVNGLIREAHKKGMRIIYSTVGRRDAEGKLQKIQLNELYSAEPTLSKTPLFFIDVPLEAGFDMEPALSSKKRPIDLCQEITLKEWDKAVLPAPTLQSSQERAKANWKNRVLEWLKQLEKLLPSEGNVLIAHTMAGGVPRAKIFMPILNRVLKGRGERFFSSETFWQTSLGQFCKNNFNEVTAQTFKTLVQLSAPLRNKLKQNGRSVFYVAYSYHGTEVLMGNNYVWQTYSPYLQGFAKINLENISKDFFKQGVKTCVFNVPEILTRSSSVFPGVEIPLYTLLGAFKKEGGTQGQTTLNQCLKKLKEQAFSFIMDSTKQYFESSIIQENSQFDKWPQHNNRLQMEKMMELSKTLSNLHKEGEDSITSILSEVILSSVGRLIFQEMAQPSQPVCWLNHDIIARDMAKRGAFNN